MEEKAPESWDVPSTIRLAKLLPSLGVDILDVSTGGNNAAQSIPIFNAFQVPIAGQIRAALHEAGINNLLIGAVGSITEAEVAKSILENGVSAAEKDGEIEIEDEKGAIAKADVVLMGRQFLREPETVLKIAHVLGVNVKWPTQYFIGQWGKKITV